MRAVDSLVAASLEMATLLTTRMAMIARAIGAVDLDPLALHSQRGQRLSSHPLTMISPVVERADPRASPPFTTHWQRVDQPADRDGRPLAVDEALLADRAAIEAVGRAEGLLGATAGDRLLCRCVSSQIEGRASDFA